MIQHRIHPGRSLAVVEISGSLGDDEAVGWFESFVAEVRSLRKLGGLVDTRGLDSLGVSAEGVRRITAVAESADTAMAGSRWAIVASLDVVFGTARMYEILRDGAPYEIRVFRLLEEAAGWLGVPEPELVALYPAGS